MRLLVISDIHGKTEMVQQLLAIATGVDLVIIAGDITNFGGYEAAAGVIEPILAKGMPILAVAGNCDTEGVEEYLADKKIAIEGCGVRRGEYLFVGVGGSLPCPGNTPSEHGEEFFRNELNRTHCQLAGNLVVVTHQPAFGTNVDCVGGLHRRSEAVRRFIETHKPILAISGHIHEAFGKDTLGPTTLVNPGALKQGRYAIVEIESQQVRVSLHNVG